MCPIEESTGCETAGVWVFCKCVEQMEEAGVEELKACDGQCKAAIDALNEQCKDYEGDKWMNPDMDGAEQKYDAIAFELFVKEGIPVCEGEVEAPPALILKVPVTAQMELYQPSTDEQNNEEYMASYAHGVELGIH